MICAVFVESLNTCMFINIYCVNFFESAVAWLSVNLLSSDHKINVDQSICVR